MAKSPAFQFYVKDWLSDPQLKMASHSTKGIWTDLLCYMWDAPVRGELTGTREQIQRLLGAKDADFDLFLEEAKSLSFCYFCVTPELLITVRNRRMYREAKDKENNRVRQGRFRDKRKSNGKVTHVSPSSSPSPKENKDIYDAFFNEFWTAYPKRNGKVIGKTECYTKAKSIKAEERSSFVQSVKNYASSKQAIDGYAKDPIRFFKIWQDWIEPERVMDKDGGMTPEVKAELQEYYKKRGQNV